jgi:hypothetical protein
MSTTGTSTYNVIQVTAEQVPISMVLDLDGDGNLYRYQFDYNGEFDFYTVTVIDINTSEILYTGKLVYGVDALAAGHNILNLTNGIIPWDFNNLITECNAETFDSLNLVVASNE